MPVPRLLRSSDQVRCGQDLAVLTGRNESDEKCEGSSSPWNTSVPGSASEPAAAGALARRARPPATPEEEDGGAMPQSRRYRRDGDLPATLRRSCREAQEAFTMAHDEAVQAYGEGDQAYRAAFTALKREFEKRGDHWIARREPAD
jgi:hypothetical protein